MFVLGFLRYTLESAISMSPTSFLKNGALDDDAHKVSFTFMIVTQNGGFNHSDTIIQTSNIEHYSELIRILWGT